MCNFTGYQGHMPLQALSIHCSLSAYFMCFSQRSTLPNSAMDEIYFKNASQAFVHTRIMINIMNLTRTLNVKEFSCRELMKV